MRLFVCVALVIKMTGIISFTKQIVEDALKRNCTLMMLIEAKNDEGIANNYVCRRYLAKKGELT
jgi:hypothetical protein